MFLAKKTSGNSDYKFVENPASLISYFKTLFFFYHLK